MIYVQREDYSIISHKQATQFAQRKEKKKKKITEENKTCGAPCTVEKKEVVVLLFELIKKKVKTIQLGI